MWTSSRLAPNRKNLIVWSAGLLLVAACSEQPVVPEINYWRAVNAELEGQIEWARHYYRQAIALDEKAQSMQRLLKLARTPPNQDLREAIAIGHRLDEMGLLPVTQALLVADSMLLAGDHRGAIMWAQRSDSIEAHRIEAKAWLGSGDPQTLSQIERLAAHHPADPELQTTLLRAAWLAQQRERVMRIGEQLLEQGQLQLSMLAILAQAYYADGQAERGEYVQLLRTKLADLTPTSTARLAASEMLQRIDDIDDMLPGPLPDLLLQLKRDVLIRAGQHDQAMRIAAPPPEADPDPFLDPMRAALQQAEQDQQEAAIEALLIQWPGLAQAWWLKATKPLAPNVEAMRQTVELAPWNATYRRQLVSVLRQQGQDQQAEDILQSAPIKHPRPNGPIAE